MNSGVGVATVFLGDFFIVTVVADVGHKVVAVAVVVLPVAPTDFDLDSVVAGAQITVDTVHRQVVGDTLALALDGFIGQYDTLVVADFFGFVAVTHEQMVFFRKMADDSVNLALIEDRDITTLDRDEKPDFSVQFLTFHFFSVLWVSVCTISKIGPNCEVQPNFVTFFLLVPGLPIPLEFEILDIVLGVQGDGDGVATVAIVWVNTEVIDPLFSDFDFHIETALVLTTVIDDVEVYLEVVGGDTVFFVGDEVVVASLESPDGVL